MKTMLAACILAITFVVPAFAQDGAKKGSDADEAFMTGIRKLGVMSGQAFACSKEAEQPQIGQGVIDLATQVSLHFGLQAAFIYSGSFGYGMGHDFDHATCSQAIDGLQGAPSQVSGALKCTEHQHYCLRPFWRSPAAPWPRQLRNSCRAVFRERSTPFAT